MKIRSAVLATATGILLIVLWMRSAPRDSHWQAPADLIKGFLSAAKEQDYIKARTFFSAHQLTNIAAWNGSFEKWCSRFVGYSQFEVGRTGRGKAGHYWTPVYGVDPHGRRQFLERIYAKRFDGAWSLEFGLSYEAWLALQENEQTSERSDSGSSRQPAEPDAVVNP